MHRRTVSFPTNYRATRDKKGGLNFVASTSTPARDNILLEQNWRLDHFRSNPVFLFEHNTHPLLSGLPIGAVQRIATKNSPEFGKHLRASVVFVPEDLYPFARQVEKFYEEGFLSSCSVGFDAARIRLATLDEMRSHGMGENDFLLIGEEPELIELSAAVVPVDTNALKSRGLDLSTPDAALETFLKGADKKGILQFAEAKRKELLASVEEQRNLRRKGVIAHVPNIPAASASAATTSQPASRSDSGGSGTPGSLERVEVLLQEVLERLPVVERASSKKPLPSEDEDDLLDLPEPEDGDEDVFEDSDDFEDDAEDDDLDSDEDTEDSEASEEESESSNDSEDFPTEFSEDSSEDASGESEESEDISEGPEVDEFGDPIEAQAEDADDSSGGDDEESGIDEQLGAAIGAVEELLGST